MHLADTFIQSDLHCIQVIHLLTVCMLLQFLAKHKISTKTKCKQTSLKLTNSTKSNKESECSLTFLAKLTKHETSEIYILVQLNLMIKCF